MEKKMFFNELEAMSNNELEAMILNAQKVISNRNKAKEDAIKEAVRTYKAALALGVTEEEMRVYFYAETTQEKKEVLPIEEPVSINPEEENKSEEVVTSIWDHPALTALYNPVVTKKEVSTSAPETTSVEKSDEELTSMEELLSDDPEYKEFYAAERPMKKNSRSLPTMEELLSGEPINRILCQGNLEPKGAPYRQHSRVNHVDGIIPTETATGQTLVYIPSVAA